ncbi:hypothetical protein LSAT2_028848 [Lamellibrachia satsuma]|nr:hypothetical protein LSAT2_028848 [Lamellibrachia satsuma]
MSSNIFEDLLRLHGPECFRRSDRMSRIKNSLYRYIKASGNYKKVVKTVIGDAVRFHRRHSVHHDNEVDHVCATHPVIVLAAHLCQKYNIDDEPELLRDILMSVFLCDGGFDRFVTFLDPLIFPFEVDPIIYPFQNLHTIGTISQRHLEVLEYFLSQATRITVPVELSEFRVTDCQQPSYTSYYSKVPFVEMPIFSSRGSTPLLLACHSINAPAVLLLLRYGADPMRAGQAHQIIGLYFQHPLYVIVTKLNASVFWRTHNHHLSPGVRQQYLTKQNRQDVELKLCLSYFCRSLERLPITVGNRVTCVAPPPDRCHLVAFGLHPHYRPLLPRDRLDSPAELMHICRCAIRRTLKEKQALPAGIQQLPVPIFIKQYLDLMLD